MSNTYLNQMKNLPWETKDGEWPDLELAHQLADDILLQIVREAGYNDVADLFEAKDKWYA